MKTGADFVPIMILVGREGAAGDALALGGRATYAGCDGALIDSACVGK